MSLQVAPIDVRETLRAGRMSADGMGGSALPLGLFRNTASLGLPPQSSQTHWTQGNHFRGAMRSRDRPTGDQKGFPQTM